MDVIVVTIKMNVLNYYDEKMTDSESWYRRSSYGVPPSFELEPLDDFSMSKLKPEEFFADVFP